MAEPGNEAVVDNTSERRFEITAGGRTAILEYRLREGAIELYHTQVPDELGGRGIGGKLAQFALEHARSEGLRVIPTCPYVRGYIERHPEYQDLVAA